MAEDGAQPALPRTSTEDTVLAIWSAIFVGQRIGVLSDFFELGGDSLMAMRFLYELQSRCNVELLFQDLLENPTPQAIGRILDRRIHGKGG